MRDRTLGGPFRRGFATQDWHPPGHASFASRYPGRSPFEEIDLAYGTQTLWPDHALQGSANAALHAGLDTRRIELVIRKGTHAEIDSYSAFLENDRKTPTGLAGALRELGIRRIFFGGLALDYCVMWSAEHAVQAGFDAFVVDDASKAVGSSTDVCKRLANAGVHVISSTGVAP